MATLYRFISKIQVKTLLSGSASPITLLNS